MRCPCDAHAMPMQSIRSHRLPHRTRQQGRGLCARSLPVAEMRLPPAPSVQLAHRHSELRSSLRDNSIAGILRHKGPRKVSRACTCCVCIRTALDSTQCETHTKGRGLDCDLSRLGTPRTAPPACRVPCRVRAAMPCIPQACQRLPVAHAARITSNRPRYEIRNERKRSETAAVGLQPPWSSWMGSPWAH